MCIVEVDLVCVKLFQLSNLDKPLSVRINVQSSDDFPLDEKIKCLCECLLMYISFCELI